MLILTRKPNESFFIGDNIKITILSDGQRGEVKVGIDAPRDIEIVREELLDLPEEEVWQNR